MIDIYVNEWDAYPAQWLRNLYPDAIVDETSIVALNRPPDEYGPYPWGLPVEHDFSQYRQVHFFAGIGGWIEAIRLAGWPASVPIWTGSCPCQPFSGAGDGRGFDDERDLWPDMFRQIKREQPWFVVGEQVANGKKQLPLQWLDRVFSDLESAGYTCWAVDLPAACVGSPIIRQRLFWGACRNEPGDWRRESGAIPQPHGEQHGGGRQLREVDEAVRSGGNGSVPGSAGSRPSGREDSGASAGDAGGDRRGGFEPQRSGDAGDLPGSAGGGQRRGTGAGGSYGPQAEHGGSSGGCLERSESDGRQPRRAPSDGRLAPGGCGSGVRDLGESDDSGPSEQCDLRRGIREADGPGASVRPCRFCGYRFDQDACGLYGCPNCHGEGLEYQLVGGSDDSGSQGHGWNDCAEAEEFPDEGSTGSAPAAGGEGFWDRFSVIRFTDGKQRRIGPGVAPLAHGLPAGNAWAVPRLGELGIDAGTAKRIVALARSCRVGTLRGFGNAIVPQVAARFLRVWMEVLGIDERSEVRGESQRGRV